MTMSQPTPGELRQLFGPPPASGELQRFLDIAHSRGHDEFEDLDFTSPAQGKTDAPAPRRYDDVGLWLAAAAALVMVILLTIWSIGKLTTGISETPHAAPLPAAPFNYAPAEPGNNPATRTATPTPGGIAAGGGVGAAAAPGPSTTTTTPTAQAGGPAAALPAGPRAQTPAAPLTGDQLVIPALGVAASVSTEHIQTSGAGSELVIPGDVSQVGWWDGSAPLTATTGSVLIAGHIDNVDQGPGALHDLYQAQAGDLIYLTRGGVSSRWKVVALQIFPKDAAHPDWFAGTTGTRELHLVTCGGPLLTEANGSHTYADNVVVIAVPA